MKHILTAAEREHLRIIGIPDPPSKIEVSDHEYQRHLADWRRTLPHVSSAELHHKVLAHAAHAAFQRDLAAEAQSLRVPEVALIKSTARSYRIEFWIIIAILVVLLFFVIHPAHAQFSKVSSIAVQNQGTQIGFFTYPFTINCSTNLSCSVVGSTFVLTSSSTGSTAWSAITASTNSNAGTFAATGNSWDWTGTTIFKLRAGAGATTSANGDIAFDTTVGRWHIFQVSDRFLIASTNIGTSGQVPLSNADGTATFGDPQVTGNVASGAADSGNPVKTGYVFNSTQPTVTTGQRVDAQGTARGAAIVATGVDTFHVTVDSAPTTTVTGTVTANQGTANTLANAWPAKITDATNGPAAVKAASTAPAATDPSLVVSLSQNAGLGASATPVRVDPTGTTTQPVSVANTPNVNIQSNASVNVAQVAGSATSTAATGVQKVGIVGNTGAAMDAAGQNAASPANELLAAAQFNTTPTTVANGNISPLQMDSAGNLLVNVKAGGGSGGTSSSFGAVFPGTGTAAGFKDSSGNMAGANLDASGNLKTNCISGCAAAGDTIGSSASLAALNNTASVALAGENGANVIFTGASSPSFTVVPEVSPDGGTTWFTGVFLDPVSGATSTSLVNPANGQWMIGYVGPESNARVRVSAFTSGSITAQLRSTVTSPYKLVLGSDGTNVRIIRTASDGTVRVDPTGTTTQPVSGTVTANAGSGTFAVSGTVTANQGTAAAASGKWPIEIVDSGGSNIAAVTASNAVKVDGSAVTQPVSAASLPLPSGAATSANQPPLAADNSANSSSKNPVIPCRANASNPSWTEGNQVPCSTDLSGNQRLLLNSWLGSTAPTVGSKTSANSIPVVPASDWVDTATGNKSDNGAAAGADRIATLPAIIQTTPGNGTAGTQGRNAAIEKGTDGLAWVASLPARRPCSYYASTGTVGVTTAATATDIAVITGNATTDVLVTGIKVSATQTTAGNVPLQIIRRSSADTAGTETNLTIGKDEPNCGASSIAAAGVGVYTANPTLGTLDSIPDSYALGVMAPGTATANDIFIFNRRQKPIVLVGTAQQLAVNICSNSVQACTGTTVTGGVFRITFEWEEVTHITP